MEFVESPFIYYLLIQSFLDNAGSNNINVYVPIQCWLLWSLCLIVNVASEAK